MNFYQKDDLKRNDARGSAYIICIM